MSVAPHPVQNRADFELSVPSARPGGANKDKGDYMPYAKYHNM